MTLCVYIVNHEHTEQAIALRDAIEQYAPVHLIDSGSRLSSTQARRFDQCLPNVYYSGLLNAVVAHARHAHPQAEVLYFICSDILIADTQNTIARMRDVFADASVGVCSPALDASPHASMLRQATDGVRTVPFVEGACFAARVPLLRALTPVDTTVNALGWGLDVQLGYLALSHGLRSVVDDSVRVVHPPGHGYSDVAARAQRWAWARTLPPKARLFQVVTANRLAHTRLGAGVLCSVPW